MTRGRALVESAAVRIASLALSVALGATPFAATAPATAAPGAVAPGLSRAESGPCAGAYEVAQTDLCSHGPDPVPHTLRTRGAAVPSDALAPDAVSGAVGCDGDGESGKRVQGLYVYVSGRPNRRSTYVSSFRTWAANVDATFRASAAETGGSRRARWVTNADCLLAVPAVAVTSGAETNFGTMIAELAALGYNRNDRKYLVWFDSDPNMSSMCGIATVYGDDRPTDNVNDATTGYARADFICWNWIESHELMHTLGAVQRTAPHATNGLHCTDDYDVMCYPDAPTTVMTIVCPATEHDLLFDCGHDDYFSTAPSPGSYLATHWNTADSGWLIDDPIDTTPPIAAQPRIGFVSGTVLASSAAVRVAWDAAADDSGIAAYELQRRKDAGSWVSVSLPDATATSVDLNLSVGAHYVFRLRARDGAGNTGPWTTTPAATLRLLEETASAISYSGDFTRQDLAGASGGYVNYSRTTGSTARLTFHGPSVALVSTVGPRRGMAGISVDGGATEALDLYAGSQVTRQVVWVAAGSDATHNVELTVSGVHSPASSNARIDVDAFLVWKTVP